ncbi:hypothetical protein DITRI_Ditri12bG0119800 [Diplodiscus trichospermus]
MAIRIISKEVVKPSSLQVYVREPFSISLLDQVIPAHYIPTIYFYTNPSDSHFDIAQVLEQLKNSVSKALNQFYPLSGRTVDNLHITSYNKGVPYVEARVKGRLCDYIEKANHQLEILNQLLPCQCYCSIPTSTSPQIAVQVNIFDCGGIAIAMCSSHKIVDGTTLSAFMKSWAAYNQGSNGEIPNPDLLGAASRLFPPLESVPQNYLSLIESLWFKEGWHKTRRFVFDENAIATLVVKAKSKRLEHPSRFVALSAFLWKYAMLATRSASGISKPSILTQSVNLRQRMKPRLPNHSMGNLYCSTISMYKSDAKDIELHHLASLVREAMDAFNDQLGLLQSGEALQFVTDQHNQVEEFAPDGEVELFDCTSWLNTVDGDEADFGWGKPTMTSGGWNESRYHAFANTIIIKSIGQGQHKALEVVITLDEKAMDILERHPDFLAFASPNPYYNKI